MHRPTNPKSLLHQFVGGGGGHGTTSWHWPFISNFNDVNVQNNTHYISSGRQLTIKINTQHKINVLTQTILPLTLTLFAL